MKFEELIHTSENWIKSNIKWNYKIYIKYSKCFSVELLKEK